MDKYQFYIVGYRNRSSATRYSGVCLQYVCASFEDDNLEKLFDSALEAMCFCLNNCAGEKVVNREFVDGPEEVVEKEWSHNISPFCPHDKVFWKTINPTEAKVVRREEREIMGKYIAEFLCYDRTDIEQPEDPEVKKFLEGL